MNTLLTLRFNGGGYHGFQVQKNAVTICSVLQDAMQAVLGARPDVKGCSRTDAGVHARQYCVSFRFATAIPDEKLPLALNAHLPLDVRVTSARRVDEGFHARYSCMGKEYEYVILNSAVDDPFALGQYYRVAAPLDEAAMHRAGQAWVGRHDFASFMSAGSSIQDTVRTINRIDVSRQGEMVLFRVAGDGFLYNQVRIMAGTLLAAGLGQLGAAQAAEILAAGHRSTAGATLPARGLFLNRVFYADIEEFKPM